jgi:hypothetical protein
VYKSEVVEMLQLMYDVKRRRFGKYEIEMILEKLVTFLLVLLLNFVRLFGVVVDYLRVLGLGGSRLDGIGERGGMFGFGFGLSFGGLFGWNLLFLRSGSS